MIELVVLLMASMWLFMLVVAGVLKAFDFIAEAFPPAFSDYESKSPGSQS